MHVFRLRQIKPTRLPLRRRSSNPKHDIRTVMVTLVPLHVPTRVPAQSTTRAGPLPLLRSTTRPGSLPCAPELPSSRYGTLCMPRAPVLRLRCPSRRKRRRPTDITAPRSRHRPLATCRLRPRWAMTVGGHREVERKVRIIGIEILVVGGYTIGSDCCHFPIYLFSFRLVSSQARLQTLLISVHLLISRILVSSAAHHICIMLPTHTCHLPTPGRPPINTSPCPAHTFDLARSAPYHALASRSLY